MELLEQIVSIGSGFVGLGAGLAALRIRSRTTPELPSGAGTKLMSYRDETALERPSESRYLRTVFLVGGFACLLPAPLVLISQGYAGLGWLLVSALYFSAAYGTGRERSLTFRSASLTIESPLSDVLSRSRDVLISLGLRIASFDTAAGVIEARRNPNLRTNGEWLTVRVSEDDAGYTHVTVESDLLRKGVRADFGANQRNVDRFVAGLLRG